VTRTNASTASPTSSGARQAIDDAARVLEAALGLTADAGRVVRHLRGAGGLDEHFARVEAVSGAERIELEVLDQAEREASGTTLGAYAALLQRRRGALESVRDEHHRVELTTIHGAKGRQWPHVELSACVEAQLPHRRALEVGPAQRAAGEGLEAERRLAYVAFTRAQRRLVVSAPTDATASRFLTEAGFTPKRPHRPRPPTATAPPAPGRPARARGRSPATPTRVRSAGAAPPLAAPVAAALAEAERTGLTGVLRTVEDRGLALHVAAAAIEQRRISARTRSDRTTAAKLLGAIAQLEDADRQAIVRRARVDEHEALVRMPLTHLDALAAALREHA
jgi:hypothetical protein